MDEQKQINLKELSIKWRSKKEMYDLLATDADMYVTPRNYPLPGGGEDNFFEKSF